MKRILMLTTMVVALTLPVYAQTSITTRGEGLVEVEPDQAIFRFSVVSEAKTAQEASRLNEDAAARTLREVRRSGLAERFIQVSGVRLQPKREWDEPSRRWIDQGFEAVRDVTVTVNDLDMVPGLVAGVVAPGANRINGLQYTLQDTSLHEQAALALAVRSARARAMAMAHALDYAEIKAVRVVEDGLRAPEPVVMEMAMLQKSADSAEGNPEAYASGLITVRAAVIIDFVAVEAAP